jgi:MFS family permease
VTSFNSSFGAVQWVVLSYLITITVFSVSAGSLGDRFGKRRLLFVGLGVFTIASALCAVAPNLPVLVAGRALQGAGAALLNALSLALVVDIARGGNAGGSLGFISAASATGTMVGPTFGALLIGAGGWRAIFLINVPLAVLVYLAVRATTAAPPASAPVVRAKAAITQWQAPFIAGLAMNLLISSVMVSTLILAPFVLSRTYGLSIHAVGLVMAAGPLATVLAALAAGRAAARIDSRAVTLAGLATFTLGALGLALLHPEAGLGGYIVPIVLIGLAWGLFQTSNNNVMLSGTTSERRGAVSGWIALARNLGMIGGAALTGWLFDAVTRGDAMSGPAVAAAVRASFAGSTAISILALALGAFVYLNRPRAALSAPAASP